MWLVRLLPWSHTTPSPPPPPPHSHMPVDNLRVCHIYSPSGHVFLRLRATPRNHASFSGQSRCHSCPQAVYGFESPSQSRGCYVRSRQSENPVCPCLLLIVSLVGGSAVPRDDMYLCLVCAAQNLSGSTGFVVSLSALSSLIFFSTNVSFPAGICRGSAVPHYLGVHG